MMGWGLNLILGFGILMGDDGNDFGEWFGDGFSSLGFSFGF